MNPRGFFALFKVRPLFLLAGAWAMLATTIAMAGNHAATAETEGFHSLILAVPWLLGAVVAPVVQQVFHTTFGGILPGLRVVIRRWFTLFSLSASLVCVLVFRIWYPDTPWFPAWMLAWMMMCLVMPFEPQAWCGSWIPMLVVFAAGACGLYGSSTLHQWMLMHPRLIGLVTGAAAMWCLQLAFDRNRLRRRAVTPRLPPLNFEDESALRGQLRSQHLARGKVSTRRWGEAWLGRDLWAWTKAAWYENAGAGLLIALPFFPLLNLVGILFSAKASRIGTAEFVYYSLVEPKTLGNAAPHSLPILLIIFIMIFGLAATAGLRNDRVYPLSRRERAEVSFRSGLWFEFWLCGTWGPIQLVIVLTTKALATSPLRMPTVPWFAFELGVMLSILPLLHWATLLPRRFGCLASLLIAIFIMPVLAAGVVCFFAASIFGLPVAAGLATCTVIPLASHALTWWLLRRHYARCDLVTTPQ